MAAVFSLIKNIKTLYGIHAGPQSFKKGKDMSILQSIDDAYLLIENDRIKNFGPSADSPNNVDYVIDAKQGMVLPAFCDPHTHLVYAAPREGEFVDRIKGLTYEEIAARGGGILNSAQTLRNTPEEKLYVDAFNRLQAIVKNGTAAVEVKSGYGLNLESEIKMLRVIKRLKQTSELIIKSTFLGAHAIPKKYQSNRKAYIKLIIEEMLPKVAEEELADYCDVFCDHGFFTVEETDIILKAAWKFGLKPKIHANELAISGGVQVAVANRAVSVDHLERVGQAEIDVLKASGTIPTLLPGTSFFLKIPYAPARAMIDSGLGIALASDYNPGSSPSGNMMFINSLACIQMDLLPEEAINATTINSSYAMEVENEVGTICPGKIANLIITREIPSLAYLAYSFGENAIQNVIVNGKIISV